VIEKEGAHIELATSEQVSELRRLLKLVTLPADQEEKWFKAAKVNSYEEMDATKVVALIDYVKKGVSDAVSA
jgi:hypothetical protein